ENAGFIAKRRNMHYDILGDPFFRQQDVPRQLELATARADGDTSRPAELSQYAARSAAEKRARRASDDTNDTAGVCRLPRVTGDPELRRKSWLPFEPEEQLLVGKGASFQRLPGFLLIS